MKSIPKSTLKKKRTTKNSSQQEKPKKIIDPNIEDGIKGIKEKIHDTLKKITYDWIKFGKKWLGK